MNDSIGFQALAALGLLVTTACSDLHNCPSGREEPIVIDHGLSDIEHETYLSAPLSGPLDAFPAKTKLRFEHELGFIPAIVKVYLAFDPRGTNGSDSGSVAESAGNQALISCVDAHVIEVRNDTCEDGFYISVVATDVAPTDPDGPDLSNACSE